MDRFDDNEYSDLIGELLHDTQYIEISNRGKMAGLRKHAEVLVRKILDIGSDYMLMLGQVKRNSNNSAINGAMESLDDELSNRLIEITRRINPLGSDGTHTQRTEEFSQVEIEHVEDVNFRFVCTDFYKVFHGYTSKPVFIAGSIAIVFITPAGY